MSSVLFVCLGNICRSPAAEGVFKHLVDQHQLTPRIRVDSAGTSNYHIGDRADPRMIAAARGRGYRLTSRARQITTDDLDEFALIVAMDRDNLSNIRRLGPAARAQVRLLSDWLDDQWPVDVPDPYYGGESGFGYVLDMLEAACPPLLDELLKLGANE